MRKFQLRMSRARCSRVALLSLFLLIELRAGEIQQL
jgi:hypothetical protein